MPETNIDAVHGLLRLFEGMRKRPGMYLGSEKPEAFMPFIRGLECGCALSGIEMHAAAEAAYMAVIVEHGWDIDFANESPLSQMRRRGLDDRIILNTLIDIEVEVLKRHYNLNEQ